MAILVDKNTRLAVQGITGKEGSFHARQCKEYGTNIVAGVTPGKAGQVQDNVPVFDSVRDAVEKEGANTSLIFVPPPFAADAILEALDAQIGLIVCITEGIPVRDMITVYRTLKQGNSRLIGPNCPGVISPGICELGATAHCAFHGPGKVGVVSVTGSGQWYISRLISLSGLGISTYVGIGGDPVKATSIPEAMGLFEKDPDTEAMMLVSEIGGTAEIELAQMIKDGRITKPIVAYIYGRTAPEGKRMGHAGAIVEAGRDDARTKMEVLRDAGVRVILYPWEVVGAFLDAGIEPKEELHHIPVREATTGR